MTQTLSSNVNGTVPNVAFMDLYLDPYGNISVSYDLQAVLEECAQAAQTRLGELIYNTNVGIPYEQVLWVGAPNIEQFNAALRVAFLSIDQVTDVISLTMSQTNNTLTYTAIINTTFGVGAING